MLNLPANTSFAPGCVATRKVWIKGIGPLMESTYSAPFEGGADVIRLERKLDFTPAAPGRIQFLVASMAFACGLLIGTHVLAFIGP
jgi:hypothetical protein